MPSHLAKFALVLLLLAAAAPVAQAQDYPNRPVRMVIAFPAGGPTDFVGRLLADKVKDILGQTVIIENKPGANGAIGADYVAKSPPDGYTLFLTTVGAVAITPEHAHRPALRHAARLRAGDAGRAQHHRAGGARRQPGQVGEGIRGDGEEPRTATLPFASTGIGSTTHLAIELFRPRPASNTCTCPIAARRRR